MLPLRVQHSPRVYLLLTWTIEDTAQNAITSPLPRERKKRNGHQSSPAICHRDKAGDVLRAQRWTLRILITVLKAIEIAVHGQETYYRNDPKKYDLDPSCLANKVIELKLWIHVVEMISTAQPSLPCFQFLLAGDGRMRGCWHFISARAVCLEPTFLPFLRKKNPRRLY